MNQDQLLEEINDDSILERISKERKAGIASGDVPEWYTTGGYQMFLSKYQYENQTVKESFKRIAAAAAFHMPVGFEDEYEQKFFDLMWKGWLAPSTPVMANMGLDRGCPVSCSGSYVGDEVYEFYNARTETAMLTKNGFGTSSYLGDIRPRGSTISKGGFASGILTEIKRFVDLSSDVTQGQTRRGAWAGYVDIDHGDFYELVKYLINHPDGLHIGWVITDKFIDKLKSGDKDAHTRFRRALKTKCVTGKGYFFFVDNANRQNPPMYTENDLKVKASNLCSEIMLHSDKDHTFTCVLSSMNASKYEEWKDTDAVFTATIFLDCVAEEFIRMGSKIKGLEKAVRFTEKGRALGLGVLGFHTYLQEHMIPFEGFKAMMFNSELFSHLNEESLKASKWLAEINDREPEWCKGFGVYNTHRIAIAPNSSSALLVGGVSQGIEPVVDNVFNQLTPAGEIKRINPTLLKIMKEREVYNKKTLKNIIDNFGSVQHVDWLDTHEKKVFKTAFEINQFQILVMADARQRFIDQGQSLNLFFDANESEEFIAKVHQYAFMLPKLKALYYLRSRAGIQASKETECLACEG